MKRLAGYSLIECMLAMAMICILLSFSIPSLKQHQQSSEIDVLLKDLKEAIEYSKLTSISTNLLLKLQPLDKSQGWSSGLALVTGYNGQLIREWKWDNKNIDIIWYGFQDKNALNFSNYIDKLNINGHFIIGYCGNTKAKVIINRLARVRIERQ